MTTYTPPPDDGMATTMEDLDRQANEQQREEAKRNGGNGSHRPMGDGWFWRLTTTKHGNPHNSVANIYIELQHDPDWQGVFHYDALQHQLILKKPVPDRSGESCWDGLPREWQETDSTDALRYFNLGDYPNIGLAKIDLAIQDLAQKQLKVHPIRDYLDDLRWDGQRRIGNWLEALLPGRANQRSAPGLYPCRGPQMAGERRRPYLSAGLPGRPHAGAGGATGYWQDVGVPDSGR